MYSTTDYRSTSGYGKKGPSSKGSTLPTYQKGSTLPTYQRGNTTGTESTPSSQRSATHSSVSTGSTATKEEETLLICRGCGNKIDNFRKHKYVNKGIECYENSNAEKSLLKFR